MMLGNSCAGATERPSDGPVVKFSTGGFGACPVRCGAETCGAEGTLVPTVGVATVGGPSELLCDCLLAWKAAESYCCAEEDRLRLNDGH